MRSMSIQLPLPGDMEPDRHLEVPRSTSKTGEDLQYDNPDAGQHPPWDNDPTAKLADSQTANLSHRRALLNTPEAHFDPMTSDNNMANISVDKPHELISQKQMQKREVCC